MNETAPSASFKFDLREILAQAPGPKHADGIHFGLDEEAYHADNALGSGSVRDLAKCPIYYWQDSWMNPFRERGEETPALLFGRALHKLVLEGGAAFAKSYVREPTKADHPEALCTATEISAELKALGLKVSGSKPEITERLREADPGAVFWDDIVAAHQATCAKERLTSLKAEVYARVVAGGQYIKCDESVNVAFEGGCPEVSLFWTMDGVRMKARLDYLRLGKNRGRPAALVTDLKSFANKLDKPPERAVMDAIVQTRLDIQGASYLTGCSLVSQFIREGKVFNAPSNTKWLEALAVIDPDDWLFYWCFYQKDAPISLLRGVHPRHPNIEAARMDLARALDAFRDHVETFGTEWRFVDPIPDKMLSEGDLPSWLGA